jgi:hypothetical protein
MKKMFVLGAIAVAALMVSASESNAGQIRVSFGSRCGGGYYGVGYGYPSYSVGRYHGVGYRVGSRRSWPSAGHWDYHPPAAVRHRHHYHVVPGHYDFHRSRHWGRYHY